MSELSVSVILPCRNEAAQIEECLTSILAQDPPSGGFEVIVADGCSDDPTRQILDKMSLHESRLRVISNPGRFTSCGLNAALRVARGAVILRMDAHTIYAPDYIKQCIAVLQETGADNVGGPWVAKGVDYMGRAIAAAFGSYFASGGSGAHRVSYEGPVDTVYLGCWQKSTFDRFGVFDEELVRNQDDEHNLRIERAGGLVWQSPRIRSWYTPRNSLSSLFGQYFQYGYWKVRVIQKHRLLASFRHVIPAVFVIGLLTGWLILPLLPWFGIIYKAALALYFVFSMVFSVQAAVRYGLCLLPVLPLIFFIYHTAYGAGFLLGIIDFVLMNRCARSSMRSLTRMSSAEFGKYKNTRGMHE